MFSPRSNSLRTTVISDSRSSPLTKLLTSRSRFESDAELEVLVGGGHGLEVVGAVVVRGAVEAGPVIAQRLGHLRVVGRALEDHVLEQVSHAGFAVAFVAAAHEHGHVHGHGRPRRLGKEQHPCPVGEPVLRHALDRGDFDGLRHRRQPDQENPTEHKQRRMADPSRMT